MQDSDNILAIIAGRGDLPEMIISQCKKDGRDFLLIAVEGQANNNRFSGYNPHVIHIGHVSKALKILRDNGAREIVFAGGIDKPSMSDIKVDIKGASLVSKILGNKLFGDNNVLNTVLNFFEKEGFKIIGVDKIIDNLVATKGVLGNVKPKKEFMEDIDIGSSAIEEISKFDIGQSIAVQQKLIIGVEAAEGTDALILRCGSLQFKNGRKPILVKKKKVGQNDKVDLPSLGADTIENLHKSGFAGVAMEAGSSLIINRQEVIKLADKYGLFLLGI